MHGHPPPLARLLPLLLLASLAGLTVASADPMDTLGQPVDAQMPIAGQVTEEVEDFVEHVMRMFRPVPPAAAADFEGEFKFECEPEQSPETAGQQSCKGYVCWSHAGEGSLPVSPPPEQEISVGVDLDGPDEDGTYGPYTIVHVTPNGNCGCGTMLVLEWIMP